MHAVKMPRGAVSNLTMFLLIIITALLVAVAMLYVQNQNMARLNAGKTIGDPPAAESASVSEQPETPADDSAPEDIEDAGQEAHQPFRSGPPLKAPGTLEPCGPGRTAP